jgi:hypothetical protein
VRNRRANRKASESSLPVSLVFSLGARRSPNVPLLAGVRAGRSRFARAIDGRCQVLVLMLKLLDDFGRSSSRLGTESCVRPLASRLTI